METFLVLAGIALIIFAIGSTSALKTWVDDAPLRQKCAHKWDIIDNYKSNNLAEGYGQYVTLQCEKCGEVKYK